MLTNLHVKNLALIEEANIDFEGGLNILTGETGAGKSIVLGSVNIALGGKVSSDMIRQGAEYALCELSFYVEDDACLEQLKAMDLEDLDERQVIISRKISGNRTTTKVNGMTCSASVVKRIGELLIDIHGQHDNQMLLKESCHLQMLDLYGADEIEPVKSEYQTLFHEYRDLCKQLEEADIDDTQRERELSFLEYQIAEIEQAKIEDLQEDITLEQEYRKMVNSQKIMQELSVANQLLTEGNSNIVDQLGIVVKAIHGVATYDDSFEDMLQTIATVEDMIADVGHSISAYVEAVDYDESDFLRVENRLDVLNSMKAKYGKTLSMVMNRAEELQDRLEQLNHHNSYIAGLEKEKNALEKELLVLANRLTKVRKKVASDFAKAMSDGLMDLNFLNQEFLVEFIALEEFASQGLEQVRFLISTNVGEPLKPLSKVTSGGELSRIMLAMKSILAGKEEMQSLIFDEIDSGISGRTAQKVAEKLKLLSKEHQIICITHLPQIAAMSDFHFLIEKTAQEDRTITQIRALKEEETVMELARMLGGNSITEAVLENAREMRNFANN